MKLLTFFYNLVATGKALFTLWPLFLLRNPRRIRFFILWLFSLRRPKTKAFQDGIPLINFEAIEWLESFLNKEMIIFEYGSGGSTLFIAKRVKWIISVEHDLKWFLLIFKSLREKSINNCKYILKEPTAVNTDNSGDLSDPQAYLSKSVKNASFQEYCQVINSYSDSYFDLIFIDGRARPSCIFHAFKKVRPAGFLLLDDSNRERYRKAISLLEKWPRKDFRGPKPYLRGIHQTTLWQRPSSNNI